MSPMAAKKKTFNVEKEIKKLARERVGKVPPGKPIQPKRLRKKPKHKKPVSEEDL